MLWSQIAEVNISEEVWPYIYGKKSSFIIKNSYTKMNEKNFESLFIDILLNNDKLTIGTIYRSPN